MNFVYGIINRTIARAMLTWLVTCLLAIPVLADSGNSEFIKLEKE